jgi:hypothetical protein
MTRERAGPYGPSLPYASVDFPRGPEMGPFGFSGEADHDR